EAVHADHAPRFRAPAHHDLAEVNDIHRVARLSFRYDSATRVEVGFNQHRDQEIETCAREATEERCSEQKRLQIGRTDNHEPNISRNLTASYPKFRVFTPLKQSTSAPEGHPGAVKPPPVAGSSCAFLKRRRESKPNLPGGRIGLRVEPV